MNLSEHFTLAEFTHSNTADARGLDNTLPDSLLSTAVRTAELLEKVRTLLGGLPIHVNSGYRSPELNVSVGGVATSEHCKGMAVDFVCPDYGTPKEICEVIADSSLEFGQLIFEGTWVHISLQSSRHQNEVMTLHRGHYLEGIQ